MSDIVNAIMDSAERRMRLGGFNGFSFRDIAAEVGIKSSSVHYHFPTKEKLAAAVTRRYTDRVLQYFNDRLEETSDPVKVWTRGFRSTLHSPEHMCPCTVLGASTGDLPPEVATEVQRFYKLSLERLVAAGLSARKATELLATLTGALILANSLDDMTAYDQATRHLLIDSEESAVDVDAGLQLVEK